MKKLLLYPLVLYVAIFGIRALLNAAATDYLYDEIALEAIMRGEEGAQIPCGGCIEAFESVEARNEHIYQTHINKGSGSYTCEYEGCGKTFTCSCQLRPHIRKQHGIANMLQ